MPRITIPQGRTGTEVEMWRTGTEVEMWRERILDVTEGHFRRIGYRKTADRAYDADSRHDLILDQGGEPVVPPRRHRKHQHVYDRIAYKQRWGIDLPNSNNGDASQHAMTSSPPISSAS